MCCRHPNGFENVLNNVICILDIETWDYIRCETGGSCSVLLQCLSQLLHRHPGMTHVIIRAIVTALTHHDCHANTGLRLVARENWRKLLQTGAETRGLQHNFPVSHRYKINVLNLTWRRQVLGWFCAKFYRWFLECFTRFLTEWGSWGLKSSWWTPAPWPSAGFPFECQPGNYTPTPAPPCPATLGLLATQHKAHMTEICI